MRTLARYSNLYVWVADYRVAVRDDGLLPVLLIVMVGLSSLPPFAFTYMRTIWSNFGNASWEFSPSSLTGHFCANWASQSETFLSPINGTFRAKSETASRFLFRMDRGRGRTLLHLLAIEINRPEMLYGCASSCPSQWNSILVNTLQKWTLKKPG